MPRPPTPRGRPKDLDKRAAIREAATVLFLSKGYHGTSMNQIATHAGVSKLTLYSHYRNKEDLCQHCIIAKVEQYTPPTLYDPASSLSLSPQLIQLGQAFIQMLLSDDAIQLYRMMASEAHRGSKLGELFFAAGPQRTLTQFDPLLRAAIQRGELHIQRREPAAKHFFALLQGDYLMRAILGEHRPTAIELRRHVQDVVQLFLKAYRD